MEEQEKKKPLSIELINKGKRPVIVKRTAKQLIVLHPKKTMRLEYVEAQDLIKNNKEVKEVK